MSTFSSRPFAGAMPRPVSSFKYRETGAPPPLPHVRPEPDRQPKPPEVSMSEEALAALLAAARAEAASAAEMRLRAEQEARTALETTQVGDAIEAFRQQTAAYYSRVEGEVVRLALSIAAKILHREAQVDPMLVAALVQIAVNQLRENTAVTIRIRPEAAERWRAHFAARAQQASITVQEDPQLEPGGCVLETELGTANFSLAAQLKEVEQGFFDILAQTPRS